MNAFWICYIIFSTLLIFGQTYMESRRSGPPNILYDSLAALLIVLAVYLIAWIVSLPFGWLM